MATGDLKRSLRNLEQGIRLLGYPREVDYSGLVKGDPAAYLPIISHSLTSYSTYVAEFLVISNTELTAKNDYRFIDSVYKLLRDKFHYKPILTKKQFFQYGFVEWKIQIVCDILNLVMKKHKELCNLDKAIAQKKKIRPIKSEAFINFEKTLVEPVIPDFTFRGFPSEQKKPIVERHPNSENFSHILFSETEGNENFVEPGRDIIEITCESQDTELNAKIEDLRRMLAECQEKLKKQILIEDKLRYLEEQLKGKVIMQELDSDINFEIAEIRNILAECQEKLKKQSLIEDKLRYLEEQLKGKVIIDEMVWNNLLSRVTLLETEMLLHFKKYDVPSDSADMKEDHKYSRNRDLSSPDRKRREEVPESLHQQLSGYNLLLSADSSPQPNTINYFGLTEASKETTMEKIERIKKIRLPPEFEAKEIDGRKKGNRRACEIAAKEAVPS
ncbi:centrosomal protein of 44 kDa isoform X5 [Antechinus flavipes]|uniref:centrosomal protein of 44 kDa isoform X5 n=1 Tax=Antechinus flavipes TaxID=38775 RepID=UPI002235D06E|nr:centrosomal protein of 44 kDa isoform X5 [Antechinus flavipes]